MVVEYETDIARLKEEAKGRHFQNDARERFADATLIINANILTMESGKPSRDIIRDGLLLIRGGVIEYVGGLRKDITDLLSSGINVINAHGGV